MQVENEHAELKKYIYIKIRGDDYLASKENTWSQHEHYYCIGKTFFPIN